MYKETLHTDSATTDASVIFPCYVSPSGIKSSSVDNAPVRLVHAGQYACQVGVSQDWTKHIHNATTARR